MKSNFVLELMKELQHKLIYSNKIDIEKVKFYKSEFDKIKRIDAACFRAADHDANKTLWLEFNSESVICFLDLLIKQEQKKDE